MKEPPKKELRLLKITTKNEDQIVDRNNRLEVRISKEETTTIVTMGLGGTPPISTRNFLRDQTSHMGKIAQIMEDHLINAQISHLIETMETDLEMDPSTTRMGIGETMENFLVLHRPKGEISHKIAYITNLEVINPTNLLSTDLTIDPRLAFHLMNKSFHKTITRRPLMWSGSPQPTILLMNYQIFAL